MRAPAEPQSPPPLRVGVIGCGLMGRRHAAVYAGLPNVALVAIADIDAETATTLAGRFGCAAHTDWRRMLAAEELDAVSICLPDRFHREATLAAFAHDLAVLLEKPLATDPEEGAAIVAAAEGRALLVGHMLRFDPRYQLARRNLRDGRIGAPVHFKSRRNSAIGATSRYGDTTSLVWHVGIHDIDLLQWTAGQEIVEVKAHAASRRLAEQRHHDSVLVLGRFADATPFSMELSWILPAYYGSGLDAGLDIVGTEGRIEVHGLDQGLRVASREALSFPDTFRWFEQDDGGAGGIIAAEIAHFIVCLQDRRPFAIRPAEALSAVEVALGIERSIATGRTMHRRAGGWVESERVAAPGTAHDTLISAPTGA